MTSDAVREIEALITRKRAEVEQLEATLAILRSGGEADSAPVSRRPAARTKVVEELLAAAGERGMTRSELAHAMGASAPRDKDLLSNGLAYLKRVGRVDRTGDGR